MKKINELVTSTEKPEHKAKRTAITFGSFKRAEEKQIQERILRNYNLSVEGRNEIFNPETDHPEDAPEITKEGYSFAKNRFFVQQQLLKELL